MFEHKNCDVYTFDAVPCNTDCYLMSEEYIQEYESALLEFFRGSTDRNVGHVGAVAVRQMTNNSMSLSWYPNTFTRFHEVSVSLPKDQFVACVGSGQCDEKPHIFVKPEWLKTLYERHHSVFCLVDAIGFADALQEGLITRDRLQQLRSAIDALAADYPDASFLSFADTLLLKSNWTAGHFQSHVEYTYRPEIFLHIIKKIQNIYAEIVKLRVYAIVTQGSNEYYSDSALHASAAGNHVCFNSLGLPFAQLWNIEDAVKKHKAEGRHEFSELYMDTQLYWSPAKSNVP